MLKVVMFRELGRRFYEATLMEISVLQPVRRRFLPDFLTFDAASTLVRSVDFTTAGLSLAGSIP
jgi:hypothetical protein